MVAVGSTVVRTEGWGALYKGLAPALVRSTIAGGCRLSGHNALKAQAERRGLLTNDGTGGAGEASLRSMLAVGSGVAAMVVAAPFDLARTRQAMHKGAQPSMAAVIKQVVVRRGVRGLFTGVVPLLGKTAAFNVAQLGTYDWAKRWSMELFGVAGSDDPAAHVAAAVPASAVAGFAATMASCPAENIKTVMQAKTSEAGYPRRSMVETATWMARTNGLRSFWRGWVPLYLRLGPHTLLVFVLSEKLRGVFQVRSVT